MENFIKNKFNCSVTTLAEAGVEVRVSAQVRLGDNLQDAEYCEITPSNIRPNGDFSDDREIQTKVNLVSLNNQVLQAGDVLIPAKKKLSNIAIFKDKQYPKESKFYNLPTVATIGMLIIRTNNNDTAEFIEFFFSLPEVQKYININLCGTSTGRITITRKFIANLPFPSIINKDLSEFVRYKHKLHITKMRLEKSADELALNMNDTLAQLYDESISHDISEWDEFDTEFKQLKQKYPALFSGSLK